MLTPNYCYCTLTGGYYALVLVLRLTLRFFSFMNGKAIYPGQAGAFDGVQLKHYFSTAVILGQINGEEVLTLKPGEAGITFSGLSTESHHCVFDDCHWTSHHELCLR